MKIMERLGNDVSKIASKVDPFFGTPIKELVQSADSMKQLHLLDLLALNILEHPMDKDLQKLARLLLTVYEYTFVS